MERTAMLRVITALYLDNNAWGEAARVEQMREWSGTWPVGIGEGGPKQIEASAACCSVTDLVLRENDGSTSQQHCDKSYLEFPDDRYAVNRMGANGFPRPGRRMGVLPHDICMAIHMSWP